MRDKIIISLGTFCIAGILIVNCIESPFYINYSASEPVGFYYKTQFDGCLQKGELVFLEVPRQARPYLWGRGWMRPGELLLKNVGAIAGDQILITTTAIYINEKYIGPIRKRDSQNRPLPVLRGNFEIEPGNFLPIATNRPNSFDGRYFGPVSQCLIRGKAKPILIFQ
jgi:conjugative transfer signal peptidase TraF